jgi:transposase-like protein
VAPESLQAHAVCHIAEQQYRCPHCGRGFQDRDLYTAHLEAHAADILHTCADKPGRKGG